ncbi:MAG: S49 family peptidase [Pseudomonadota bacterium]
MKLIDLITAPWAISQEKLREIQAIYSAHLHNGKIDLAAIEARLGRPLANEQQDYQIRDGGVAVLTLDGVMAPKANMFMRVSGGISTQLATQQLESAAVDPRVTATVLAIDSPGGSVFGTPEFGASIRELSAIKPIVTVSDATLCSAAYWAGSSANGVYITGPTVQVGSIGVVASHSYDPRAGATTTEITAGKYKRIASDTGPLSAEGLAYMQSRVDYLYSVFVDAVADNRGTSIEAVLEHMADGRVWIGQQAIDQGLVDGYSTVDAMVEQLATNPGKFSRRSKAVFALGGLPSPNAGPAGVQTSAHKQPTTPTPATQRTLPMDRATLEKDHPALFAQLQTEFTAMGATAERARIQAVESAVIPGHEALIAALKFDGKTSGGDAALAVNKAERDIRTAQGKAQASDAPPPVAQNPAPTVPVSAEAKAKAEAATEAARVSALPVEDRCKAQWEASADIRGEFSSLAAYTALVKAEEAGKVRVLGKKAA